MNFIIIGNGVAGVTVARSLIQKSHPGSKVLQFTTEPYGYYSRPKLPQFLGDKTQSPEDLMIYTKDWYIESKIDFHPNEKIHSINRKEKKVVSEKGEYGYDKLLLAQGASCACPPIPGLELEHAYTLRTLADAITIRNQLELSQSVVIIGGGLLGIENAIACAKHGLKTTIIEFFPHMLPRQLDPEGSKIFTELLAKYGVEIITSAQVKEILGDSVVESVQLKDGRLIPADIVMTCTGIKPRIALAKKAGLDVNRGVVVNDYLETSDPNIFAVGDMAEHEGKVYGIIPPTTEQSRVVVENLILPRSREYHGSKMSTTLKVADLFLTSIGYDANQADYQFMKYINDESNEYMKIFHEDDKIKAIILLGTKKGIPQLRKMFEEPLSHNQKKLEELFPGIA
ncbi:MAG: NAD(P)/FAD-dependent oxidoreductase [Candidatus Hodarchaeales archaeon]|jgi:nitrite reductase (NADH) large subunit